MIVYEGPLDLDRLRASLDSLYEHRETGYFELKNRQVKRTFTFDMDAVRISNVGELKTLDLGNLLVLHGKVTQDQLKVCLEQQKRLKLRLNEVIAVMNILPQEDVVKELMAQLQEEFCALFTLDGVTLKIGQDETEALHTTQPGAFSYTIDALELAHEISRRIDEWKKIQLAFPSRDAVPKVTPEGRKFMIALRRRDPLQSLMSLANGTTTLSGLVDASVFPRFETWRALYSLFSQGYLEVPGARRGDATGVQAAAPGAPGTASRTGTGAWPLPGEAGKTGTRPGSGTYAIPGGVGTRPGTGTYPAVGTATGRPPAGATPPPLGADPSLGSPTRITSSPTPMPTGDKGVIMIIEDLPHIRRIVAYELERAGFRCLEASNGREGLDLLANLHVDLVICDMMMPVLDGLSVCREIRRNPEHGTLPVLMLTARTRSDAIAQILSAGANDYLFKPYKKEQLIEKAAALVKQARK